MFNLSRFVYFTFYIRSAELLWILNIFFIIIVIIIFIVNSFLYVDESHIEITYANLET